MSAVETWWNVYKVNSEIYEIFSSYMKQDVFERP